MDDISRTTVPPRLLSPLIVCCLAATWLIWGSTYLVIRFALVGFPPFFMMATRFLCAGGLAAVALGAAGWALGSVLSQRGFALAPGATGFGSELLCGGLALLAMSSFSGESWHWPTQAGPWMAWGYLTTFGTLIAFNAYMLLLARTSATLAASYSLVNPVVALMLGVTLGQEIVSTWEWVASGIVMVGVVLLFMDRRQPGRPS